MTRRHPSLIRAGAAALVLLLPVTSICPLLAGAQAAAAPNAPAQSRPAGPTIKPDARKAREAYQQGLRAEQKQDWQSAHAAYSDAVNWAPENREYQLRREIAKSRLVQEKMDAAERDAVSGRLDAARKELVSASYLDPSNAVVRERLAELAAAEPGTVREAHEPDLAGQLHLAYQPGTRSFDYRGDTQGAYREIARQFGVEAAFDVDLLARPVRFRMDNIDFLTAARLLGEMTRTFWRPLTRRLFFITEDSPQKRREYEPSIVRTVVLPASQTPEQMTELLRLVREVTGITRADLDAHDRTLTLRASPRAIALAADLIDDLEKPAGELILEIEILEVDRNYARQLGITPPQGAQVFTFSAQQIQEAASSYAGLLNVIEQVFGASASSAFPPLLAFGGGRTTFLATLPGAAANFSRMLSLVRHGRRILLRAQDGRAATFFVGDRIPVTLSQYAASLLTGSIGGASGLVKPITNYAAGTAPSFMATASLRGDGINDLIVANAADSTISVLLGDGQGAFASQVTYPSGTQPVSIATGQFNNSTALRNSDSFLDLAVANQGANTVSILLGNGDGTFRPKTDIPTGTAPVSVIAADFHDLAGTGFTDLAVANQGDDTISIFQGNGDGTFKTPTLVHLPAGSAPRALAAADLNRDGHIDLVVADQGHNTVSVFLGNGDGTFQAPTDYPTGNSPVSVALGSFTGNGALDIAVANSGNSVTVYFNQLSSTSVPLGQFVAGPTRDFAAGNGPTSIVVADFNGDGNADLAVSDQADNAITILLNAGNKLFTALPQLPVGTAPASIAAADFNGDGRPDGVTADSGAAEATVILNSTSFFGAGISSIGTPFPGVQYLDIGLKVKATPRMHPDGDVTLQLGFDISSLTSQSFNTIPVIRSESLNQTVRLKQNETAALAGFLQSQVSNSITGAPGIAGRPGIGWLGQNQLVQKQDSELLILVTPRLVRLAPHPDHAIYVGHGSLDGASAAAPGLFSMPQPQPPPAQAPPVSQPVPPSER
ncbi:MAG: FG-GAP-like repeat-containing protein [Acidobacteriia bacterium]|nr:FG-GAP-like repeat-containing protein [Terriglobia bacterium]